MIKKSFTCLDGISSIRVEDNGRVRLILRPEERVILLGQWSAENKILLLYKNREVLVKKSFSLAVPHELWAGLDVKTVAVQMRDTGRMFCADKATLTMFGYVDDAGVDPEKARQRYLFLDFEHWSEVRDLEDAINFSEDNKARHLADKEDYEKDRFSRRG